MLDEEAVRRCLLTCLAFQKLSLYLFPTVSIRGLSSYIYLFWMTNISDAFTTGFGHLSLCSIIGVNTQRKKKKDVFLFEPIKPAN